MRHFWIAIVLATSLMARGQVPASTKNSACAWTKGEMPIPLNQSLEAAKSGNPFCQYMLGQRYESGIGIDTDYAKAAIWYQKASQQGFAAAQWSLGRLYAENKGVPQDYQRAYFWLSLASSAYSAGTEAPLRRLVIADRDSAAKHLTKSKLLAVQEQTQKFLSTHPKSQ
jgi:TPR repeat protein